MPRGKASSGTRKYGRNKDKCAKYRAAQRREKSHISRIRKHIGCHPHDKQAVNALKAWEGRLK